MGANLVRLRASPEPLTMLPSASHEVYSICDDTKLAELAPPHSARSTTRCAVSRALAPAAAAAAAAGGALHHHRAASAGSSLPHRCGRSRCHRPRRDRHARPVRIETAVVVSCAAPNPTAFRDQPLVRYICCLCEGGDRARLAGRVRRAARPRCATCASWRRARPGHPAIPCSALDAAVTGS